MNSLKCNCGLEARRNQVKKEGPTHGRFFFGYCGFFKWCDDVLPSRQSANNVFQPTRIDPPFCEIHQIFCIRRVSRSEKNPGRAYYSCPSVKNCKFLWAREYDEENRGKARHRVECQMNSRTTVFISVPTCQYMEEIKNIIISVGGKQKKNYMQVPLNKREIIKRKIKERSLPILFIDIPRSVLQVVSGYNPIDIRQCEQHVDWKRIPPKIVKMAYPFQKDGIIFGIMRNGNVLIADEMGLGKSIQAIGIACYFKRDWPLLIICPSSLKVSWHQQIQTWAGMGEGVQEIKSGSDRITGVVVICSYELAVNMKKKIEKKNFKVIIVDETHYLKNPKSKRVSTIIPMLQKAKRTIMLTGTPALSRPTELYSQISAIFGKKKKWISNAMFQFRYCDAHFNGQFIDDKGFSNLVELNFLLETTIMVRRLKKSVLLQLPTKRRQQIFVTVPKKALTKTKSVLKKVDFDKTISKIKKSTNSDEGFHKKINKNSEFMAMYRYAGVAKLPAIESIIDDMIKENEKFVIYAHHRIVLDRIEDCVKKSGVKYIRIDGGTKPEDRAVRAEDFRKSEDVLVAVLSILACGVGLTLTPCHKVVFAELTWTPGGLQQAEDRVHRIGQTHEFVDIKYILGKGTVDERIWGMVIDKLGVVGEALDYGKRHRKKRGEWEEKTILDEDFGGKDFEEEKCWNLSRGYDESILVREEQVYEEKIQKRIMKLKDKFQNYDLKKRKEFNEMRKNKNVSLDDKFEFFRNKKEMRIPRGFINRREKMKKEKMKKELKTKKKTKKKNNFFDSSESDSEVEEKKPKKKKKERKKKKKKKKVKKEKKEKFMESSDSEEEVKKKKKKKMKEEKKKKKKKEKKKKKKKEKKKRSIFSKGKKKKENKKKQSIFSSNEENPIVLLSSDDDDIEFVSSGPSEPEKNFVKKKTQMTFAKDGNLEISSKPKGESRESTTTENRKRKREDEKNEGNDRKKKKRKKEKVEEKVEQKEQDDEDLEKESEEDLEKKMLEEKKKRLDDFFAKFQFQKGQGNAPRKSNFQYDE